MHKNSKLDIDEDTPIITNLSIVLLSINHTGIKTNWVNNDTHK